MTPRFLLDTNIIIYIGRKRPKDVLARFAEMSAGEAVMSVVTHGELAYGVEKSMDPRAIEVLQELVELIPVIALPPRAGTIYGTLRADLARRGQMIGGNDLWIATHAMCENLSLVTNNEQEFRRVPGLVLANWVTA